MKCLGASLPRPLSFLRPRSLMGQMMWAVAVALLLVQGLGAALVYRAQRESYEHGMLNAAAMSLLTERPGGSRPTLMRGRPFGPPLGGPPPRRFRLESNAALPVAAAERRDRDAEEELRAILAEQSFAIERIEVVHRTIGTDPVARSGVAFHARVRDMPPDMIHDMMAQHLLVVAVKPQGQSDWLIARVRSPRAERILLGPLILQTLMIYIVLFGAVALILRRITRPLAALTRRVERFAASPDVIGQLPPSGPEDMRHLIVAHNAMEQRIASMLDEKDVMLGAIGHDLKTPLTALRVRIESVEDEGERRRMAGTIEDIVRTLDDILSLARVGRPSDPRERTEVSALVASVVEEYEDMGEPVDLGDTQRIVAELRPTWLRRALRNLIGNALRYGHRARVTLRREGTLAVVEIEDDGPGIPDDQIGAMMDPFIRGDPSRNSATGGAGLGLCLARAIADQHGGALILKNRRDGDGQVVGLTARLEIPAT